MVKKHPNSKWNVVAHDISIGMWTVQCGDCLKWRSVPTQEEYEEIRSKAVQDPFVCSKIERISCEDPTDIVYDNSRIWVMDKHNLPKTPPGFRRRIMIRRNFLKLDCFYDTPNGKTVRSSTELENFLDSNQEYSKGISPSDFSFVRPKLMEDTIPVKRARTKL